MVGLSIFHWIAVLVFLVSPPFAIGMILKRDGLNPFWAVLYVVPLVNIVALWIWALSDRPAR